MPKRRDPLPTPPLSEQLRGFMLAERVPPYRISKAAGVAASVVTRFLNRETDYLTGPTVDKLASAMGLDLVKRRSGLR